LALLVLVAIANAGFVDRPDKDGYVQVPGGWMIHETCKYRIEDGWSIQAGPINETIVVNDATGEIKQYPPCVHKARQSRGVYDIDTDIVSQQQQQSFNATMTVPGQPPQTGGQILYWWPGFKSTSATPGLPVLQPVLEFSYSWSAASWYVYGNEDIAYESTPISTKPGDTIFGYMNYDAPSTTWTILTQSIQTGKTTTLKIPESKMDNHDFFVSLLCFETYFCESNCKLYSDQPAQIVFDNMIVNGVPQSQLANKWVQRTGQTQCDQGSTIASNGAVTFHWNPNN
jgi:hypothetical protein